LAVEIYVFGQQLDGEPLVTSLIASVLLWKTQGSPVDNDPPWGRRADLPSHASVRPGGHSVLNHRGIDVYRLLEAGQITDTYMTTMIYTHELNRGPSGYEAPLTCSEERRDLLRTVQQSTKQVATAEKPC
jgi:hypothetical protein